MTETKHTGYRIDNEFFELIQPCTPHFYTKLEEDIFDNGCQEPLLIWNNTIIDGHKRYSICHKWDIPYKTESMHFKERIDAISYICSLQLKRTDLTMEMTKYLVGKKYHTESEICKRDASPQNSSYVFRNDQPCNKYETARLIGMDLAISHATVMKYDAFAIAIDSIKEKEPLIASRILAGKSKVSHENTVELSRLPKDDLKYLKEIFANDKVEHIGFSEIRHELQWRHIPVVAPKEKMAVNIPLRKIPKYDPDAEISSLILTIPSWISSIERSANATDFQSISASARTKATKQLFLLDTAVQSILEQIKESR